LHENNKGAGYPEYTTGKRMTFKTIRDQNNLKTLLKNINSAWQVTGGGIVAPVLLTFLIIQFFTNEGLVLFQWLLWLHLPFTMFHEFEEYVFPGGFKLFINTKTILSPAVVKDDVPANDPYIFFVNIVLIWPWLILGAVFYTLPWIGFSAILFQFLINNVQHTVVFQVKQRGYNPGLFTTMFILIPYCTFVAWYVIDQGIMSTLDWILSFAVSVGIIVTLASITLTRNRHAAQE